MKSKSRVVCTLENASEFISGVRFGALTRADGSAAVMSEPIDREAADNFCQIAGYELAAETDLDQADEVDAAIVKAQAAPQGTSPQATQTIEELQRANHALSDELHRLREAKGSPEEMANLRADNKRLGEENAALVASEATLRSEVEALRTANAALAGEKAAGEKPAKSDKGKAAA